MKKLFYVLICISLFSISEVKAQGIVYSADFTTGTMPTGWTTTQLAGSEGWQLGSGASAVETYNGSTLFSPPSNYGNMIYDLAWNNPNDSAYATADRIISPSINLSSSTGKIFAKFESYFLGYYTDNYLYSESLTIEVSTNNGSTWSPVQTVNGGTAWQNVYADISSYGGQSNVMICLHYSDEGGHLVGAALSAMQVFTAGFVPTHEVTFEEATGMWCGFCVRGIVFQDSLEQTYPNSAITISVHNDDPLALTDYNNSETSFPFFSGFPTIVVNRMTLDDPSDAFNQYTNHINDFGMANLSINSSYNSSTREVTVNTGATFATSLNGDYSLALVLTEDSVMGNSTSYDQSNYYSNAYSNGYYGTMGDFNSLPEQVPYTDMYYMFVARAILGSYSGSSGSIPTTITANTNYPYKYTYTIPSGENASHMKAIVLLIDNASGDILNSSSTYVIQRASGINQVVSSIEDADVFPNPVNSNINVMLKLSSEQHTVVTLTDMLGRVIANTDEGTLEAGQHNYVYDATSLSTGIYLVTIKTGDGQAITRKIVKQ